MNDRPKLPQTTQKKAVTIGELLERESIIKRIADSVPQHVKPAAMVRVLAQALYKTPKLKECEPWSLMGAMMACASLGLEPNTMLGHAWLIPFENRKRKIVEVQVIIGYRGLMDLAYRSGKVTDMHADVVYKSDEFEYEYGSNRHLRHKPRGTREEPTYAYGYARLLNRGEEFEVIPYEEILRIRDKSDGYRAAVRAQQDGRTWVYNTAPWVAFEHEMALKTAVRRLVKRLPLSLEVLNTAMDFDDRTERSKLNFGAIASDTDALHNLDAITEGDDEDDTTKEEDVEPKQTASRRKQKGEEEHPREEASGEEEADEEGPRTKVPTGRQEGRVRGRLFRDDE